LPHLSRLHITPIVTIAAMGTRKPSLFRHHFRGRLAGSRSSISSTNSRAGAPNRPRFLSIYDQDQQI
jgi:hypothetical protein